MIFERSFRLNSCRSCPSSSTLPSVGTESLLRQCISVDFPAPFGPRMQTNSGLSMVTLTFRKIIF